MDLIACGLKKPPVHFFCNQNKDIQMTDATNMNEQGKGKRQRNYQPACTAYRQAGGRRAAGRLLVVIGFCKGTRGPLRQWCLVPNTDHKNSEY